MTDWPALWEKQLSLLEDLPIPNPGSVAGPISRAYRAGKITKPLAELTDDEILLIRGIGKKRLAAIREIVKKVVYTSSYLDRWGSG